MGVLPFDATAPPIVVVAVAVIVIVQVINAALHCPNVAAAAPSAALRREAARPTAALATTLAVVECVRLASMVAQLSNIVVTPILMQLRAALAKIQV